MCWFLAVLKSFTIRCANDSFSDAKLLDVLDLTGIFTADDESMPVDSSSITDISLELADPIIELDRVLLNVAESLS
jgi:hypothetical protein